jgi:NAD(P)-dependent dehydrogenase (short-subunit alcohol dehydrogenase family)
VQYKQNRASAEKTVGMLDGEDHFFVQSDIGDPDSADALVQSVIQSMGSIDVLINNAGIYHYHSPVEADFKTWCESWDDIIRVNLLGASYVSYGVIQNMKNRGGGRIVNISSRGAFRGEPDAPAYGASKAGLNAMGQSLAKALAPFNILVYTVAPGFVETEMAAPYLDGPEGEEIRNQSPLGRVAKPEEVARTVLFLASEGAEFLTGSIIDINGASYLRT